MHGDDESVTETIKHTHTHTHTHTQAYLYKAVKLYMIASYDTQENVRMTVMMMR